MESASTTRGRAIGLALGPAAAVALLAFADLQPGQPAVTRMAALAVWMAIWWVTEAVPLAVTALLPAALFPLLGIMSGKDTAPVYFNDTILLFLGGFLVALAMERWNLHRRVALRVVRLVGTSPRRLLVGFLAAAWLLSMWISNTACTMMLLPIVMAVLARLDDASEQPVDPRLAASLLLAIAYGASIGGIATPVGTPPNLSFLRLFRIAFPDAPPVTFVQWVLFAVPVTVVVFVAAAALLAWRLPRAASDQTGAAVADECRALGPMGFEERIVLGVFVALAALWMTRSDLELGALHLRGWASLGPTLAMADDGTVATALSLLLFVIPSRTEPGRAILTWSDAGRLPWGVVLLFGGGFALASGIKETGLSLWVGERLQGLGDLPPLALVLVVACVITFLTELTSNTACVEMVMPILAAVAVASQVHPLLLMLPATLSASLGFMMPAGTPPNAIVFGTGRLSVGQMARAGLALNLISIMAVTLMMVLWGVRVFGITAGGMPAWAVR